ncbi:GAP1-N1 domain-containing protein [Chryseobacterium limigenitum]|uniref:Fido domain-containing protein n=1 Tax=Chryseobacterium limigenitum TaxID=1612149 RepID=A0A1K2IL24_9FLAO|nr:effector-associated domain EAD1-containing protein [Chryseobacterium limigenitum]SFZ92986.1 hypothetical protein SAMN05216324_10475 [Chryseobacterium limigenitum]
MIEIHQAIFGQGRDQGHSLLKASKEINNLAGQIFGSTDVIDRPNIGTLSSPIIRGFIVKDHYLFIKSFTDPSGRPGRVFSHALILKVRDYLELKDISDLRRLFLDEIDKSFSPDVIEYENNPAVIQNSPSPKERYATAGLIDHVDYQNVIAWTNENEYWNWIGRIWSNLPKPVREKTQIGNAFNSRHYSGDHLFLLLIPDEMNSNWSKDKYCIIDNQKFKIITDKLENYILGIPDNIENIKKLLSDFEPKISEIDDLKVFAQFSDLYEEIDNNPNYLDLLRFSAIVSAFNSDIKSAVKAKKKLLDALSKSVENISAKDFYYLQGQNWIGFDEDYLKSSLVSAISRWLHEKLYDLKNTEIVIKALVSSQKNIWYDSVNEFIRASLKNWKPVYSKEIWKWINCDNDVIPKIFSIIPEEAEKDLVKSLPDLSTDEGNIIIDLAEQKLWMTLYGILAVKQYKPIEAFSKILAVKSFNIDEQVLKAMSDQISSKDFISCACDLDDIRMTAIAVDKIKNKPALKQKQLLQNSGWQKILIRSIDEGLDVWEGINNPKAQLYQIMDLLIQGEVFEDDLLNEIAKTGNSSLKDHPQREAIWPFLPAICKSQFIASTLVDCLLNADSINLQINDLEQPLLSGLKSSQMINEITGIQGISIDTKLELIPYFNSFSEHDAILLIQQNIFTKSTSEKIASLISKSSWRNLVQYIFGVRKNRPDLDPILKKCAHLLSFWDRLFLTGNGFDPKIISKDEVWEVLVLKVTELYPEGPNQHGLWERSGGHKSDLYVYGSARQIWQNAISHIKNGGNPKAKNLLKCMIEDFSHDESLKQLKQLI